MLLGERRSKRRDHIADTCFVARDGVGISLDHHRPRIGDDMLLRPVETIEVALLVKDGGFGRVEIFRLAVPHHAAAEGDAATPLVEDGKHHAIEKAVGKTTAALHGDVGVDHLLRGEPRLAQVAHERFMARGEPQPVATAYLGPHAARCEVFARTTIVAAHELRVVERGGRIAYVHEPRAFRPAVAPIVRIMNFNACTISKVADGLGKRKVLTLHHVGEAVAPLAASEAMPNLGRGNDMKRRGLLAVKGTAPPKVLPPRLERNRLLHKVHEVGCRAHAVLILIADHTSGTPFSPKSALTVSMLPSTVRMSSSTEENFTSPRRRRAKTSEISSS